MTIDLDGPLLLVGAGNMGGAMLAGWLGRGLDAGLVLVQDPAPSPDAARLMAEHHISPSAAPELAGPPTVVVMAVKPQIMNQALDEIKDELNRDALVISIAAGVRAEQIEQRLGGDFRVVRVMPNTPALVGKGPAAVSGGRHANESDLILAEQLMQSVGFDRPGIPG